MADLRTTKSDFGDFVTIEVTRPIGGGEPFTYTYTLIGGVLHCIGLGDGLIPVPAGAVNAVDLGYRTRCALESLLACFAEVKGAVS